jgi:hypothetical protein
MFNWLFGKSKPVKKNTTPNRPRSNRNTFMNILQTHDFGISNPTRQCLWSRNTRRRNTKLCGGLPVLIIQNRSVAHTTINNTPIHQLEEGVYLFIISYNKGTGKFSARFSRVNNVHEIGSRHFLMVEEGVHNKYYNKNGGRFVVAAGELQVLPDRRVLFNLESGTLMYFLEHEYKEIMGKNVKNVVKNIVSNTLNPNKNYTQPSENLGYTKIEYSEYEDDLEGYYTYKDSDGVITKVYIFTKVLNEKF